MTDIIDLVHQVADELSLARPNDISDTTDDNTAQKIVRHMVKTCRQLGTGYDWAVLRKEKTFTTVASETQTDAIPDDFLRFVSETMWNRTTRTKILGPLTPDDWQARQAVLVNGPWQNFMIRGTSLIMTPVPSAGWTVAYEYITKTIGENVSHEGITTFASDDDRAYFDDELIILGTVWRYRKAEGLDYSEEFREFQMRRADLIKMDGGRRRLDMNADKLDRPVNTTYTEIPELVTI